MAEAGGVLSGTIQQYFDEYKKAEFVTQLCRAQRVPLERCVAIGDSRSDIPLFRRAGLAIALNASRPLGRPLTSTSSPWTCEVCCRFWMSSVGLLRYRGGQRHGKDWRLCGGC